MNHALLHENDAVRTMVREGYAKIANDTSYGSCSEA